MLDIPDNELVLGSEEDETEHSLYLDIRYYLDMEQSHSLLATTTAKLFACRDEHLRIRIIIYMYLKRLPILYHWADCAIYRLSYSCILHEELFTLNDGPEMPCQNGLFFIQIKFNTTYNVLNMK